MADAEKWEEIESKTEFKKYSIEIERRDFKLPNGKIEDFYVRVEPVAACVLALTVENKIITLPQYRPGPRRILREIPGGQVDKGEEPRIAAERELLEETGYAGVADTWIGQWFNDAYTDSDRNIVIVRNCKKVAEQNLEGSEFGKIELVDLSDFVAQVRSGQLTDAAGAMLALDYLGLL